MFSPTLFKNCSSISADILSRRRTFVACTDHFGSAGHNTSTVASRLCLLISEKVIIKLAVVLRHKIETCQLEHVLTVILHVEDIVQTHKLCNDMHMLGEMGFQEFEAYDQ